MRYCILAVFIFLLKNLSICQIRDSTVQYSDTVIIYKDPLVIRKKVYVPKPVEEQPKWYLDLEVSAGIFNNQFYKKKNEAIAVEELKKAIIPVYTSLAGLSIFRQFENWDFGIGIQFHSYKEIFQNTALVVDRDSLQYQRRDTIDTYYNIIAQDTIYHHVIEDRLYTEYVTNIFYEYISEKNSSLFLEIPLSFKYKILKEKLSVKVIGRLAPAFLVAAKGKIILRDQLNTEIRTIKKKDFSSFIIRTGLGLEMSYPIFSNFKVSLSPSFNTQITNLTSETLPFIWRRNSLSLQVGIQFEF